MAKTAEGETFVWIAGGLHDAQEWLPGVPLSAQRPGVGSVPNLAVGIPVGCLRAISDALAHFHLSTSRLSPGCAPEIEPLGKRLGGLVQAAENSVERLRDGARRHAVGADLTVALRWLELLPRASRIACEAVRDLPEDRALRVLCHADLWPAHVHFDRTAFVGFSDFESLTFAPPVVDLAQLVAHFGGWRIRREVVRTYEDVAPLGELCHAMIPLETIADLVGEGLWSLEALYSAASADISDAQQAAHALNLRSLLGCLEGACGEA